MFKEERIGQTEMEMLSQKKLYKSFEERKAEIRTENYLDLMTNHYIPLAQAMIFQRDGLAITDVTNSQVFNLAHTMICRHKDMNILNDLYRFEVCHE